MRRRHLILLVLPLLVFGCDDANQEEELAMLTEMRLEIEELAESTACTDPTDWSFTAYGSKACGGPQGYLAYPVTIDTEAFLKKVERYTQAEDKYNRKWNIVSTCDLPSEPSGVSCENGKPILEY